MVIKRENTRSRSIFGLLLCFFPVFILMLTSVHSGFASDVTIVDNGDYTYTATWDFNDMTNYTLTNTTASNGEINITMQSHYWNQSGEQDFAEGQGSNVVVGDGIVTSMDDLVLGYLVDQSFTRPDTWNYTNGTNSKVISEWSPAEEGWIYSIHPQNITIQNSTSQPDPLTGIDTYLNELNQMTNYGGDDHIRVQGVNERRGILWFDVSSLADTKVIDAKLELYFYTSADASSLDVSAHRITSSWAEMSVSWQMRDTVNPWGSLGGDLDAASLDTVTGLTNNYGWKSWNITSLVDGWINGTYQNYGVLILSPTALNTWKQFYSSDYTVVSLRPKLNITYYPLNTYYETGLISENFRILDPGAYRDYLVADFEQGQCYNTTITPANYGEIILGSLGYLKIETMDDITDWQEDTSTTKNAGTFQLSTTIFIEGTGSMRVDYDLANMKQNYGVLKNAATFWDWSRFTDMVIWVTSDGQGEVMKVILEDTWGTSWESSPQPLLGSWYNYMIDLTDFTGDISSVDTIRIHFSDTTEATTTHLDNITLIGGSPYFPDGDFTSQVIDGGYEIQWESIIWEEDRPASTDIWVRTHTGNTSIPDASWSGWSSSVTDPDGSTITSPEGRYIQYRIFFTTSDPDYSPAVSEVILIKSEYNLTINYSIDTFVNITWSRVFLRLNGDIIWQKIISSTSATTNIAFDVGRYLYKYGENLIEFGLTVNSDLTQDVNISATIDDFQVKGFNGLYISKVYDTGSQAFWENITWTADFPSGTNITLNTRSSWDNITWSPWSGPLAYNQDAIVNPSGKYIQYRTILKTQILGITPVLKDVNITFKRYAFLGTVLFLNDLVVENVTRWSDLSCNATLRGQSISFEYSIDSGANWYSVPGDGNLSMVITSTNKIRFKAILEAQNTSLSPTLLSVHLNYLVNHPPAILGIVPDQTQAEDAGPWALDLTAYESDYEDTNNKLRWYITGDNSSLYTISGELSADDVITFTPQPDAYGNDQVVLWLEDSYGEKTSQTLWINITPVNDPPEILGVIPSFDKRENDPNWQLDLSGYKFDRDNSPLELAWSASGWDPSIFTSVSITGNIITFDLAPDSFGNDEITLVLTDTMYIDTQSIWVNVSYINKPPQINGTIPNFDKLEDDLPWVLDLTSFEMDREDPYPSTSLTWSVMGVDSSLFSLSISDNNITFNLVPNAYGNDEITIVLTDGDGAIDQQKIWVNVTSENDAPVIQGVIPSFEKSEDALNWNLDLSSYKYDVDNLSSELAWQISGWDPGLFTSVNLVGDVITFELLPNAYGSNQITITLSDGISNDTQEIWVNVTPINDAPEITGNIPNFFKNEDDIPWTLDLTSYESDVEDGSPSTILIWNVVDVNLSILSISIYDNNITFTLKLDAWGNDEIKIILMDSNGATDSQTIWINVTSRNDAPRIVGIIPSFEKNEDANNWNLGLLGYKFDVDNSSIELSWQILGWDVSLFDSVSVIGDVLTFDLKTNAYGNDEMTIVLSDGLLTDSQVFWVNITSVNDLPQIMGVIPDFDRDEDDLAWTIDLTSYESDVEDAYPSPSLVWSVSQVDFNLLSITISDNNLTFTLRPDAYGNDEIIIVLTDSNGGTDSQNIWINVAPLNDVPKIVGIIPSFDKEEDANNWNINLSPYKSDVDNPLSDLYWSISGWSTQLFDSVTLAGDILTFDLAPNAYGNDLITITLSDGILGGSPDTQDIWVNVTSINDAPQIVGTIPDILKQEDNPSWTIDLTNYESDVEDKAPSSSLTWSVLGIDTSLFSASISDNNLTFTLVSDAFGKDYITITLTDSNGGTDFQVVLVEISPINDAPTIQSSLPNIVINEDSSTSINLLSYGSDKEDTPAQLRWFLTNTNRSLYSWQIDPAINTLYIEPLPNAFGTNTATLTLMDSGGATATRNLQIIVLSRNDMPYIYPQIPQSLFDILEDEPISIILTGFEHDVEDSNELLTWEVQGVDTSIIKVSLNSENDELVIVPVVSFLPGDTETVETQITLVLRDSDGGKAQQNITVTIIPVNNEPVIDDLPNLIIKYDDPYVFDLSPYVFDEDTIKEDLIITTSEPTEDTGKGYIAVNGLNLTLLYPKDREGDIFSVLVTLSDGQLSSYTIMQVVISDHRPPELSSPLPHVYFDEDSEVKYAFDLDDYFVGYVEDPLNYTYYLEYIHHGDSYVFVVINKNNTVSFSAAENWYGIEQISFRAEDTYAAIAEGTIQVTVNPINDPPTITEIPDQECKVNVTKVLDLAPFLGDVDTPSSSLMIATDSDYITIQGHILKFYYDEITMETVNIIVSDGFSQTGITIEVEALANQLPIISLLPELKVKGGEVYLFSLLPYIKDNDNDIEEIEIWTDSPYINVNPEDNMLLQIDYPTDMVGNDVLVTLFVSDGLDTNSTQILIQITNELIPRLIGNLPNLFFAEDTIFSNELNLNDYFENVFSYQYFGSENINISIENGWLTLSAPENWSGSEMITFRGISDDAFVEDTIEVTVKPVNDPPILYPLPRFDKKVNEIWVLNLIDYIEDIDNSINDIIVSVDSPHVILYALNVYFQYPFEIYDEIIITVNDGKNSTSGILIVNVTAENNAPIYRGLLDKYYFRPGESWSIYLDDYFYDVDGDFLSFSCNKEDIVIDPTTHKASWTPKEGEQKLEGVIFSAHDGYTTIESSPIDIIMDIEKSEPSFWEQNWWLILLIALLTSALIVFAMTRRREEEEEEIEYTIPVDNAVEYLASEGWGNYLIKSETSETAYKVFSGLLKTGFEGLCITTKPPDELTKRYELGKAWIIKLALKGQKSSSGTEDEKVMGMLALGDEERGDEQYMFSSNFKRIVETIEDFITGGENKVVLLDGLEYILGGEELIMYIGFIASLRERLKDRKSCLLIPIDPKTLSDKELRLLERETVNLGKALKEASKKKPEGLGILASKTTEDTAEVPEVIEVTEEADAHERGKELPPPPPGHEKHEKDD